MRSDDEGDGGTRVSDQTTTHVTRSSWQALDECTSAAMYFDGNADGQGNGGTFDGYDNGNGPAWAWS